MRIRIRLFTLMRIKIRLLKMMLIQIRNTGDGTDSFCQGFGSVSGSAWIRINLSCWIRIRIQEGKNDPQK